MAGAAAGTKLTGWLLPLPFLVWTVLYRERKGVLTLGVGGLVAAATVYAVTPPWWCEPWDGLTKFFLSNLTRGKNAPMPVQFLGRVYLSPNQSLPWYNTLVWTVAASPVGFLAWALVGSVRAVRDRRDRFGSLAVISWAFLLILRALPHTPGHDGVRQILPAFGVLAIVAGLGVGTRPGLRSKCLIVAAILEAVVSIAIMMPVPLSYFSPAVGGLPGAARLGFEPTYYWDTFTPEVHRLGQSAHRAGPVDRIFADALLVPLPEAVGTIPSGGGPPRSFPAVAVVSGAEPPRGDDSARPCARRPLWPAS